MISQVRPRARRKAMLVKIDFLLSFAILFSSMVVRGLRVRIFKAATVY